jgi:superfamily I DNA/RNA helicase
MKRLGSVEMRREQTLVEIQKWELRETKKSRYPGPIRDQAECMRIFVQRTETLADAIAELNALAARDGRVQLMTGHKSKGLEFPRVWFLNPDLIKKNDDQDLNLWYVIVTRCQDELNIVDSKNLPAREVDSTT